MRSSGLVVLETIVPSRKIITFDQAADYLVERMKKPQSICRWTGVLSFNCFELPA